MASRQQAPAAVLPFLNAYPVANGPELGNGLAQFNAGFSNPSSLDATSLRVDHAINSKLNLFGRYNYSPSSLVQRGPLVNPALVLSMTEPVTSAVQTGTIGLTELITPAIANEARANYSNQRVGTSYTMDNFGGAVPLPNSLLFPPGYSPSNGVFSLYIAGAGEYVVGHQATSEQRQVNLVDNLSVIKSGHQLKFGVDYRWLAPFVSPFSYREFAEFTGSRRPLAEHSRELPRRLGYFPTKPTPSWRKTFRFMARTPGKSHRDSPRLMACDGTSAPQGQEPGERSIHRHRLEQSGDFSFGAAWHSALPDDLRQCCAQVGTRLAAQR